MTIQNAMKDYGVRVSIGDRWMTRNEVSGEYTVRQQKYRQKYARVLIETDIEDDAVHALLGDRQ